MMLRLLTLFIGLIIAFLLIIIMLLLAPILAAGALVCFSLLALLSKKITALTLIAIGLILAVIGIIILLK